MTHEEAIEWINGNRSMANIMPRDPLETWQVRVAEADAAMIQQAYWMLRALNEKIVNA